MPFKVPVLARTNPTAAGAVVKKRLRRVPDTPPTGKPE